MPEMYAGGSTLAVAKTWATSLTTAIKTGTYKTAHTSWTDGIDITDAESSAMIWASDSNAYVCTTVMPDGISAVENVDLSGDYYTTAMPVIELQIAKAGYRYVPLEIEGRDEMMAN
jgi:hypothetical protein